MLFPEEKSPAWLRPKSVHIALGSPSQPHPGVFAVAFLKCGAAKFVPAKKRIFMRGVSVLFSPQRAVSSIGRTRPIEVCCIQYRPLLEQSRRFALRCRGIAERSGSVGRRQAVRHRFLVPAFPGSNPGAPASPPFFRPEKHFTPDTNSRANAASGHCEVQRSLFSSCRRTTEGPQRSSCLLSTWCPGRKPYRGRMLVSVSRPVSDG